MYGSAKSSGGSTPSESSRDSAPSSAPDEPSSGGSGGPGGGGSSGGSSGSACSYYIQTVLYGGSDDLMEVSLFNDGAVDVTVTGITCVVPVTTTPSFPITMTPGTGTSFVVDAAYNDLRLSPFTVHTTCGDQSGEFPINP